MLKALIENLGWKLASLGIAIILWVTFVGSPALVTSVSAPIQYRDMPSDLAMSTDVPEGIYLEIQGPAARLSGLDASATAVILDLGRVRAAGEYTFTIDQASVSLPTGLRLVRAVPGQLRLTFEKKRPRDVPVRVRFAGPPPAGYHVRRTEVEPATVSIEGPENRVNEVGFAETDAIDLSKSVANARFRVHAFVRDPYVRVVSSPVVSVEVQLERSQGAVR
jgi:hypothetical protein